MFVFFAMQNILAIKNSVQNDFAVIITFDIIGILSFINLTILTNKIDVFTIANLFFFIFLYFCGLNQYLQNFLAWEMYFGDILPSYYDYIHINSIIILFIIIMTIFYKCNVKFKTNNLKLRQRKIETSYTSLTILTCLNIFIFLIFLKVYGLNGLLSRHDANISISNKSFALIVSACLRLVPVSTMIFLIINLSKDSISKYFIFYFINAIIVLVLVFPLGGTARYMIAATYLALAYPLIRLTKFKSIIILVILFGIVVIFPTINFFRFHSISEIKDLRIELLDVKSGDFDAYSMIMYIIKYADLNGFCFGKNFITAFLFFIPRSLWPNKMIGTGAIIANSYQSTFTNMSAPFIAESYFSLGVFGVFIGAMLFGLIIKFFDTTFLRENLFLKMMSCSLFGMVLFILRGDLLSSFSYTIGFALSSLIVFLIILIFCERRENVNAY